MNIQPDLQALHEAYPWLLRAPNRHSDYLRPEYYDQLLPEYSFGGYSDLDLLASFLRGLQARDGMRVLELGCGSGRATDVLFREMSDPAAVDLVDLSPQMVDFCRGRFQQQSPNLNVYQSDSLNYLRGATSEYDVIVSLWNLSHSVHQHMLRDGRAAAESRVRGAIEKLITHRMAPGASAFLIHYDIQSPEQKLINPWRKLLWQDADPDYEVSGQTPSKIILDEVLTRAQDEGYIAFNCTHHEGDPIEYDSVDHALEVFMNFHMEGIFNSHDRLVDVLANLQAGLDEHTQDGMVAVAPGCFTYSIVRL
ncbi:class I SAM-dependent methyltransferase [Actinocrispum sp. NPDC049592]|uniref:class I SAM-dependent methyltransferase n=1 Tax=Actinocrispum sp. NPDC049592 TaxID=3154835 RepID=UPI0034307524